MTMAFPEMGQWARGSAGGWVSIVQFWLGYAGNVYQKSKAATE